MAGDALVKTLLNALGLTPERMQGEVLKATNFLSKEVADLNCKLDEFRQLKRDFQAVNGRGAADGKNEKTFPRNPLEAPFILHGTLAAAEVAEIDFDETLNRWPSAGWIANIGTEELTIQYRYKEKTWEATEPLMAGTTEALTGYLRGIRITAGAAGGRYKVRAE